MAKRRMSTFERLQRGEKLQRRERRELERRFQAKEPGWEVVHPDVAGIDIGNESQFVAVDPQRWPEPVREFGSWTAALQEMTVWLKTCGVKRVVMQTTGVYWIPVENVLQAAGFQVAVVDARGTKNLPGRKSDVQECEWIRKLDTYGLLRESFQAPESIRAIRTVWRLRDRLVKDAGRAVQQMQKAMTTMNVQLANTISDVSGATGMAIIREIVAGERNPWELAKLRDRRIKATEEELAHSLEGNWREDVLFELDRVLEGYDFLQKQIAQCDRQVEKYMGQQPAPEKAVRAAAEVRGEAAERTRKTGRRKAAVKPAKNHPAFDLEGELKRLLGVDLTRIDGIKFMTAQVIYSELGPDLSAFPSEAHFTSWLGLAPRRDISGGKVIKQRSGHVHNRVANALRMSAQALSDSDSYLGARYRSLKVRLNCGLKATKAMARYLACLVYRMLTRGEAYIDRGAAHFEQKRRDRDLKQLQRKAAALGLQLVPSA